MFDQDQTIVLTLGDGDWLTDVKHKFVSDNHLCLSLIFSLKNSDFLLKDLEVVGLEAVGQNGKHLRIIVSQEDGEERKCIGFSFGDYYDRLKIGENIDLVCEPSFNEWNGTREIQLKIIDLKIKNEKN